MTSCTPWPRPGSATSRGPSSRRRSPTAFARRAPILPPNKGDVDKWPPGFFSNSHLVARPQRNVASRPGAPAVSGPAWIVADDDQESVAATTTPLLSVSLPGINFAYSQEDQDAFTAKKRLVPNERALRRMRQIWHHTFELARMSKVRAVVVNAIGCGAFRGSVQDVPKSYAQALVEVLPGRCCACNTLWFWGRISFTKHGRRGFPSGKKGVYHNAGRVASQSSYGLWAVFVALPVFANDDHFIPFAQELEKATDLRVPVALSRVHGMLSLARELAVRNVRTAFLNPSDARAVRQGRMGMYFLGSHIALEEVLAVQTTILLQHWDINHDLWHVRKPIPVPDIE